MAENGLMINKKEKMVEKFIKKWARVKKILQNFEKIILESKKKLEMPTTKLGFIILSDKFWRKTD